MEKIDWIKELVQAEQKIEDTGVIDLAPHNEQQRILAQETLQFLLNLKIEFYDAANIYNELKTSPLGRVKVYSIAHTHADFMLFRNGYKMLFTIKAPGLISIRMNFVGSSLAPSNPPSKPNSLLNSMVQAPTPTNSPSVMDECLLQASLGPFNEVSWTYQGKNFQNQNLIRHFLSFFLKESLDH